MGLKRESNLENLMVQNLTNPEDFIGVIYNRKVAMHCLWMMHRYGRFVMGSIINVGVGSAPEMAIWRWIHPSVPILGIDIRPMRSDHRDKMKYIQAVAYEKTTIVYFCSKCRSLQCREQIKHKELGLWKEVKAVAIDDLTKDLFCKPPYFMWMDIDGGEVLALKGAKKTLESTGWICVELTDWVTGHIGNVTRLLKRNGFVLVSRFSKDGLFCNKRFLQKQKLHNRRQTGD